MAALKLPLARLGHAMRRHGRAIRAVQWTVVVFYCGLLLIPAFLPLPPDEARILDNLTLFAQFLFWGIWWPFVLLSMVLVGRVWCGVFCPEGTLTEAVSHVGRGRGIPRWMKWSGWPFVAFATTTIYGQLVSVYQYPRAALLVLGGSTVAALGVGWLYGRGKRVWCRHLCPVNGVFGLLARLAPLHFRVDSHTWEARNGITTLPNCAPLIDIRRMHGNAACHMCGRCSGQRGAVTLAWRAPNGEIVERGRENPRGWDTVLLLYGLIGVAMGAFHWATSPWFIEIKLAVAEWLVAHGWTWALADNAPWWLLTHYPQNHDVFTWLDGALIILYILITGTVLGTLLLGACALAARLLAAPQALHHLALAYVPLGGCGVFLGLSALTVSLLKAAGIPLPWLNEARGLLLAGAALWTLLLAWRSSATYGVNSGRRIAANSVLALGTVPILWGWGLLFFVW